MSIRIASAHEYDLGDGFVIEQKRHWNFAAEESWGIPAWEEMGYGDLSGTFPTHAAARRALSCAGISPTA